MIYMNYSRTTWWKTGFIHLATRLIVFVPFPGQSENLPFSFLGSSPCSWRVLATQTFREKEKVVHELTVTLKTTGSNLTCLWKSMNKESNLRTSASVLPLLQVGQRYFLTLLHLSSRIQYFRFKTILGIF